MIQKALGVRGRSIELYFGRLEIGLHGDQVGKKELAREREMCSQADGPAGGRLEDKKERGWQDQHEMAGA